MRPISYLVGHVDDVELPVGEVELCEAEVVGGPRHHLEVWGKLEIGQHMNWHRGKNEN